MLGKQASKNFYTIAAIEGIILAAWTIYVIFTTKHIVADEFHADSGACFSTDSDEYLWRIVSTSIAVPLIIEYLLDFVISVLYPNNHNSNKPVLEDRLGHAIIVSSLLCVSYVPFWIFGPSICPYRDTFVSLGHGLIVCGVLGKLETFSSDIWHQSDAIIVLSLFFCAQISLLSGIEARNGSLTYNVTLLQFACALKLLSTLIFFTSSRNIKIIFHEVRENDSNFFVTRKYLCSTLFSGLAIFMFASTYFCYQAYVRLPTVLEIIAVRIMVTIIGVVATAIVPGRIMRRGLQAVQQTVVMQREMNYKKTFVRYISHEIRSPLSNTSMGLDCMLETLKSDRRTNRAELLDLARDCKVSCTSAVQTLSDLLLFDKIENQMLALEKSTVNCDQFFKKCVHIFSRQLKMSGIGYYIDIDVHLSMMTMYIDTSKVEQVIRNYITNAIKFTPQGGTITVRAKLLTYEASTLYQQNLKLSESEAQKSLQQISSEIPRHAPVVHFEVVDTGFGIAQENQRRLFQQYIQFDANKLQGGKGSGLGLWICKTIVDMHGGCVGVISLGAGCGSTFYFELPISEVTPTSSASSSPALMTSNNVSGTVKNTASILASSATAPSSVLKATSCPMESSVSKRLRSRHKCPTNTQTNSTSTDNNNNNIDNSAFSCPSNSTTSTLQSDPSSTSSSSTVSLPHTQLQMRGSSASTATSFNADIDTQPISFSNNNRTSNHNINQESLPLGRDSDLVSGFSPTLSSRRKKRRSPSFGEENVALKSKKANLSKSFIRDSFVSMQQVQQRAVVDLSEEDIVSEVSSSDSHPDSLALSAISMSLLAPSFLARKQFLKTRLLEQPNNKWNVLVVDDSNISRKLMARLLAPYTSHIYTAVDGQDALDKFATLPAVDIVFIDYYMPRLTGPESIQIMREKYHFSGVIISVTGALSREEQQKLVVAGVDVAMSKPFDLTAFLALMFANDE